MNRRVAALGLTAALAGSLYIPPAIAAPSQSPLPVVTPTPVAIERTGPDVPLLGTAQIVVGPETDDVALADLRALLKGHGVKRVNVVEEARSAALTFLLGSARRADISAASDEHPTEPESYVLKVGQGDRPVDVVTLGGADPAGQFYAVQTLRQLIVPHADGYRISAVRVLDTPAMPLRGSIEGFYGNPWTHAERLDQLAFYGDVKLNTYIYAPKDDPYHRDQWRNPYPAAKLAELAELVDRATENHVRFTFALSPGTSICFTSDSDFDAAIAKFEQMYEIGVRAFNVPFDDINYQSWHCDSDRENYGSPNATAAGKAQADWLDRLEAEFVDTHQGVYPLQMVPTEYSDLRDSGYKQALRGMDEDIVVMWTGPDVVPPAITLEQGQAAAEVYGGPVFVWDNYPVNDFGQTSGRLLLAPYGQRDAGLAEHLSGIVANPMNQAAASKIALYGVADFTWNDTAYDPVRGWAAAMDYLAGGDAESAAALTVFADLNHLAPTFGSAVWQPQAPALAAEIESFWVQWDAGDRAAAIADLRAYAERIAAAPATIRDGGVDAPFVADARNWLDATELWGQATIATLDALEASLAGDAAAVQEHRANAEELQQQASTIRVFPADNRWGSAPVKIADGILNVFLTEAGLVAEHQAELGDVVNVALAGTATASSVEQDLDRFRAGLVNDGDPATRWASSYSDNSWVQIELAEPSDVVAVSLAWEAACAAAYDLQVSADGHMWTTVAKVTESTCSLDLHQLDLDEPILFVRMQGVDRATNFGYSLYELSVYASRS